MDIIWGVLAAILFVVIAGSSIPLFKAWGHIILKILCIAIVWGASLIPLDQSLKYLGIRVEVPFF